MSEAAYKQYFKMIFKNTSLDMAIFVIGIIWLSNEHPELIDFTLILLILRIAILISFANIIINLMLVIIRTVILHFAETIDKLKRKDFKVAPTAQNGMLSMAEAEGSKLIKEKKKRRWFRRKEKVETIPEDRLETGPGIMGNQRIEDLEKEIAEMEE